MRKAGIFITLGYDGPSPFWGQDKGWDGNVHDNHSHSHIEKLADATFVDDQAIVLLAKTPKKLDSAISATLHIIVEVFRKFCLVVNWAPGKSEGLLRYRGSGATKASHD